MCRNAIGCLAIVAFLIVGEHAASVAADDVASLRLAADAYQESRYEDALELVEPLQESGDDRVKSTAVRYAAACHHAIGDDHFRAGDMAKCIAAYDKELELLPGTKPQHWQRGIALYYAGRYQDGVDQFELHQTVNSQDVENAVWHFLCAVRAPDGSIAKAREDLIPIQRDTRVPMAEVHRMFAGELTPDDVIAAGEEDGRLSATFYADLYVGLFYEAIGEKKRSAKHIAAAANNTSGLQHFMGDVARVHRKLREPRLGE